MKKNKTVAAAVALGLAAGTLVGCASSKINEACLVYEGGTLQDAKFQRIMKAGSNSEYIGVGSMTYCYPTDQRSYIGTDAEGRGDTKAVVAVSSDGVQVKVDYQLYFTLNQDEDVIVPFHENLGVKPEAGPAGVGAWEPAGWKALLQESVEPQIERAIEAAALGFTWRDLRGSEEIRKEFQAKVIGNVKSNLRDVIGNDYFCGPGYTGAKDEECGDFTFTVGKPDPVNPKIVDAVESEQTAAASTAAQAQKNLLVDEELKSKRELVELYGPQGALLYEALKNDQIQIMVVPQDGNISIPTPVPAN